MVLHLTILALENKKVLERAKCHFLVHNRNPRTSPKAQTIMARMASKIASTQDGHVLFLPWAIRIVESSIVGHHLDRLVQTESIVLDSADQIVMVLSLTYLA